MANMEETEREELFERMNKYERSRIINLAEKHCGQMMDLIHRYYISTSIYYIITCRTSGLLYHQKVLLELD